jgi:hypothetical protein
MHGLALAIFFRAATDSFLVSFTQVPKPAADDELDFQGWYCGVIK